MLPQRFADKVALVTGGASGIGRAVVHRLVSEQAKVIVWDIDPLKMNACREELGASGLVQHVDVTQPDSIDPALTQALAHFGQVDIVVNAAGIVGPNGPFWLIAPEEWDRVMRVNVRGTFLVSRALSPHLIQRGWGRIVNMASVTANEGPKNLSAYSASKAAVVGLTKSMGKDLADTGVLVNAVTPALIATDLLHQLTPEYYAAALSRIPMGRAGTMEEVAAMVTWLCSSECSFSTGACFDLSGGRGT
jgi:3-oxoacyl-[acyl-carrier protein] reductase